MAARRPTAGEIFAAFAAARRRASTQVDMIPPRRRAPLSERLTPPPLLVLSVELDACERHPLGFEGAISELLYAVPPGWAWEVADDVSPADAIACARHQATRRGDRLEVLEHGGPCAMPVVLYAPGGTRGRTRTCVLAVVRFVRDS